MLMRNELLYHSPVYGHWKFLHITLTEGDFLIFFCNPRLKNCWQWQAGIEPTNLDLSSQSVAFHFSAMATRTKDRLALWSVIIPTLSVLHP